VTKRVSTKFLEVRLVGRTQALQTLRCDSQTWTQHQVIGRKRCWRPDKGQGKDPVRIHHTILAITACWVTASELCYSQLLHFSRAKPACCLPGGYGYSAFDASDSVTGFSFVGTAVTSGTAGNSVATVETTTRFADGTTSSTTTTTSGSPGVQVKSFPLRTRVLGKDHCQLSGVVVALSSDGTWSVDFLAEQNPNLLPPDERPRYLVHQQNQFHVRIRPLLGQRLVTVDALDNVAVPSVASLHVQPFWLQRNSKQQMRAQGQSQCVRQYFDKIGHVAVDLSYR